MNFRILTITSAVFILLQCAGTFKKGEEYITQERYDDAITVFKDLVAYDPGNYNAYLKLGDAYLEKKEFNLALQAYTESLRLKPGWHEAELRMPNVAFQQGKYLEEREFSREAIEVYENLRKKYPDFMPVYKTLAHAYEQNAEYGKALDAYEHIAHSNLLAASVSEAAQKVEFYTARADEYYTRAQEEYKSKYYYESSENFRKFLEIKPEHKEAQYLYYVALGHHHLNGGTASEMALAIEAFGNALSVRPEVEEVYFLIAQAYEKKDKTDYDMPITYYKKVVDAAPESKLGKESMEKIKELTATKEKMEKFWKKK